MNRTIDALERRTELETARDRASDVLDRARTRLIPFEAQHGKAREASRRLETALARVYRDSVATRREFDRRAQQNGDALAAAELGRHPERFGELRGTHVGPVRSEERKEALRVAASLEVLGADHLRGMRQVSATREQVERARATTAKLERRVNQLDAELARGPGSETLRQRLGRQLRRLQPAQRAALHRSLPISRQRLFTAALMAGRAFANEQGHER